MQIRQQQRRPEAHAQTDLLVFESIGRHIRRNVTTGLRQRRQIGQTEKAQRFAVDGNGAADRFRDPAPEHGVAVIQPVGIGPDAEIGVARDQWISRKTHIAYLFHPYFLIFSIMENERVVKTGFFCSFLLCFSAWCDTITKTNFRESI